MSYPLRDTTTPSAKRLLASRVLADAATTSRLLLPLVWFNRVGEALGDLLVDAAPDKLLDVSRIPEWSTPLARCACASIALRGRSDAPPRPPLNGDMFHALLRSFLRTSKSKASLVERQRKLLAKVALMEPDDRESSNEDDVPEPAASLDGAAPRPTGAVTGFFTDGLVLALYLEAVGNMADLDSALAAMVRKLPTLALEGRAPLKRMLEWIPDHTPEVARDLADLREDLEDLEGDDSDDDAAEVEELALGPPAVIIQNAGVNVCVDFLSLVAISAAVHMNLPALEAVAKRHPRFDAVVLRVLEFECVYACFLTHISMHPLEQTMGVLDWLRGRGWDPRGDLPINDHGHGPPHYSYVISYYLDPLRSDGAALVRVFETYDRDRDRLAPLLGDGQRHLFCTALAEWVEQGQVAAVIKVARAWPWLLTPPYWAPLVTRAVAAGLPPTQVRTMLLVSVAPTAGTSPTGPAPSRVEAARPLLNAMLRAVEEPYGASPGLVTRIIALAVEHCGGADGAAEIVVERLDVIGDRLFGYHLESLGLGAKNARTKVAARLLELLGDDHAPFSYQYSGALAACLIPVLVSPHAKHVLDAITTTGDAAASLSRWSILYSSFLAAVATECAGRNWESQVPREDGRELQTDTRTIPAWTALLGYCAPAAVASMSEPVTTKTVRSLEVVCNATYPTWKDKTRAKQREMAVADNFLRAAAQHAPAEFASLLARVGGDRDEDAGPQFVLGFAPMFPEGSLDGGSIVSPASVARHLVRYLASYGDVDTAHFRGVFRACLETAVSQECLRLVAKTLIERRRLTSDAVMQFEAKLVPRVPGLAAAWADVVAAAWDPPQADGSDDEE
ncbi:hypothetical protein H9P43_007722 [Blastocladiella emersonii ATCC 22665]|nr:hypothetical protein H9P43_007722 [Blastocladiella emersonii ATCC 22665]